MNIRYDMDGVKYYQGDAKSLDLIPDNSVQFCCTSPPYFNARTEYASWSTYADYLADMALVWAECYRVLCDGGRIAVNVPMGYGRPGNGGYKPIEADTTTALVVAGFELRGHIVWAKGEGLAQSNGTAWGSWLSASNPSLRDCNEMIIVAHKGAAGRGEGESTIERQQFLEWTQSVWTIQPATSSWHPAPFPAEIPRRLIQLYTFKGDTVLDPFCGSGTVLWEAAKAGRKAIGVDLSDAYIERACGSMFVSNEGVQ
jgi:DNA modification methylase